MFSVTFLIGHLYLICEWFGEDQRTNTIMILVCTRTKEIELRVQISSTIPHSIINIIERTYVFS